MNKKLYHWIKSTQEYVLLLLAMTVIYFLLQVVSGNVSVGLKEIGIICIGISGIGSVVLSAQAVQQISIEVMLGGTRKASLLQLFAKQILVMLEMELIQVVLYFLPFTDSNLQIISIMYTPVFFLLIHALALWIGCLQFDYEKLHRILFTAMCGLIGALSGIIAVDAADFLERVGYSDLRNILGGAVFAISLTAGLALYTIGAYVMAKQIAKMDVRI